MPRGRAVLGAGTLMLCIQYFLAEGVTAAAWTHPYSYTRNYVSDLGITDCLTVSPCSPLGWVMNASFVLAGGLTVLAALMLGPLVPRHGARRLVTSLAMAHGTGSTIVGWIHSAPGTRAGTPHVHVLGAYAAILGGNLAIIVAASAVSPVWAPRWFRVAGIVVGLSGLLCGAALVLTRNWPPGLLERGAIDTIPGWEVVSGILLAVALRRRGGRGATPLAA